MLQCHGKYECYTCLNKLINKHTNVALKYVLTDLFIYLCLLKGKRRYCIAVNKNVVLKKIPG